MPVKRSIPYNEGVYFITFTCHNWLPLIDMVKGYDLVYKWFDHLKTKGHYITGYVIMPNHIHVQIGFSRTHQSINTIIGNGKRFIAYEVVRRLEKENNDDILKQLQKAVDISDLLRNKKHGVWEDSFDWKECSTPKFMEQKLHYMHMNPCKGKWNLANSPADYAHSSARFYIADEHASYAVTNYMELADIDLTKMNDK
jgi:REP element-mobilizing transposase RayT